MAEGNLAAAHHTLSTSALLSGVSERKLLPTMVAFNTLWIGL